MERLFYALQLLSLGDRKFIGQLAKYSRMDYVRKCVNTRFEMASSSLQDKWLDDQFQTWTQIITARILSDPGFIQALLDSAGSPLFDPEEPVYATALTSAHHSFLVGAQSLYLSIEMRRSFLRLMIGLAYYLKGCSDTFYHFNRSTLSGILRMCAT